MPHNIIREPVKSSNVSEIGYCPTTKRLTVMYKDGSKYCYNDIDSDLYNLIKNAKSIGSSLHHHIKKTKCPYCKF